MANQDIFDTINRLRCDYNNQKGDSEKRDTLRQLLSLFNISVDESALDSCSISFG